MRRLLTLVLLLAACAGGAVYAMDPVNNDLDAGVVALTWDIDTTGDGYANLQWENRGAATVYICVWRKGETEVPCTAGPLGNGTPVDPGKTQIFYASQEVGSRFRGIVAVSYITAAGASLDNSATTWEPWRLKR
jgi:hypothetical protein